MVEIEPIEVAGDLKEVQGLIVLHYRHTGSTVAKDFLDNWDERLKEIVRVMPLDYKRVLNSGAGPSQGVRRMMAGRRG